MKLSKKTLFITSIVFLAAVSMVLIAPKQTNAQNLSVAGRIVEPVTFAPVSDAMVQVVNNNLTYMDSMYTSSDGTFEFYDLPPDQYNLEIYANHDQYMDPPPFNFYYDGFNMVNLGDMPLQDVALTFTLTMSDGITPVSNIWVDVRDTNYQFWMGDSTNENGIANFGIPEPGNYFIEIFESYQGESPPNRIDFTYTGTPLNLAASYQGANVTGTILYPDETPCAEGECQVSFNDMNWQNQYWDSTDGDGKFSLNINVSDQYTMRIEYRGSGSYSPPAESTVIIDANASNDLGTFHLLTPNITGKLVAPDETGIANAWFDCHNGDWSVNINGSTGENGSFGIGLPSNGTYFLEFWIDSQMYPDYAAPSTIQINYDGTPQDLGSIATGAPAMRGKVTNAAGDPISFANVDIHDQNWESWENNWFGNTNQEGVFVVNRSFATGTYFMNVMPPWGSEGEGLLSSDNIQITLTEGQTDTTYYDNPVVLPESSKTITGRVTRPDGTPVTDAQIDTFAMGGMGGSFSMDETDENGYYTISVGQGNHTVNLWPRWGAFEPDWVSPGPQFVEFTGAEDVEETAFIDFEVAICDAAITGTVSKPDGTAPGNSMMVNIDAFEKGTFGGNFTQADAEGNFTMKVVGGKTYEVSMFANNMGAEGGTEYAGPSIAPITVFAGQTYGLGTVNLVEKSATVTGTITDTNGELLEGIFLDAWSMSSHNAWGWGQSESDGTFSMKLFPGTYEIMAFPSWEKTETGAHYVPRSGPQQITVQANSTVSNINFQLEIATATIKGTLKTPEGDTVNTWGWVNASNDLSSYETGDMWMGGFLGGECQNGSFTVYVPPGTYELEVFNDWNAQYTQSSSVSVAVADGEEKNDVVITMLPNDALIQGTFLDSEGNPVPGLFGEIMAKRAEGGQTFTPIDPSGTYRLGVAAGEWDLGYFVDPHNGAGYLPTSLEEKKVIISAGETKTQNFTLLKTDSVISGKVLDTDNNTLEGIYVFASLDFAGQQRDEKYSHFGFDSLSTTSASDGSYTLTVPEGEYYVHATQPPENGYMFTGAEIVYTSPEEPASDVNLIFKKADSQITGTVTKDSSASEAFIYAYSDNGAYTETSADSAGEFVLPVTSDETWKIGATDEDGNSYYLSGQEDVEVDEAVEQKDLAMEYKGEMPGAITATFDATKAKTMELENGMKLEFPAYSLDNENYVTVTIDPTAEIAYQAGAQPLEGFGYSLTAKDSTGNTVDTFNADATITMPYTEKNLTDIGLDEDDLEGDYYNTTSGLWQDPNNKVADEDNDKIIVTTDHFSTFSPVAPGRSSVSDTPEEAITLTVTSPEDNTIITTDSVVVRGTVSDATATVTIRHNNISIGSVTVDTAGAFAASVTSLDEGSNTITVNAVKDLLSASTVTRTVIYTPPETGETPIDIATGTTYDILTMTNENSAPQIRVFSSDGTVLSQFFTFSESYRGEFRVLTADVNGDNEMEIVAYPYGDGYGPQVRVFSKAGTLLSQSLVLDGGHRGGIEVINNVDLDSDGNQDLIAIPRGNGSPNLRAYKYNATTGSLDLLAWTMAYDEGYKGGVNLNTGDVTGDGLTNIITTSSSGGPNVRVYHYDSTTGTFELDDWFMAYQETFTEGVLAKVGDVNGDDQKDIVVYPEENGGPNIRAYSYNSATTNFELIDWIQPFEEEYRGSLSVKLGDLDKDGTVEVITTPATGGGPNVRVYGYNSTTGKFELKDWAMAFDEGFKGGVGLAIANMDGDDYREVVVYPLQNGGPNIRVYEYDANAKLTLLDWTLAYDAGFRGKMSINIGDLDGDGDSAVVVSPLTDGGPNVRIYEYTNGDLSVTNWFMAYANTFRDGVITKFIKR